ncbi:triose-phosphate transporter [Plectosphaerella plurivora]|uniref:Triose-phosphate transporter n=1 Tax=Plectosphaerella plurivora TaxID=936078 RepID=A0A9P8V7F9_9PEZI|nr:triose-phosphate transporter [Plectosphaerella plurivora]
MPHSTTSGSSRRTPSLSRGFSYPKAHGDPKVDSTDGGMEKFPDHIDTLSATDHQTRPTSPAVQSYTNGRDSSRDRWLPRRDSRSVRFPMNGAPPPPPLMPAANGRGHGRQKSLSDAFRTIRSRKGSVSQNAHEIADALKAPISPMLVTLCVMWYASSALTNTSSKSILTAWPKPATLTLVQFAFVASYCLFFAWVASVFPALKQRVPALRHGIRYPTREVIMTTLPLAAFQIFGHLLSSVATSKIPVSLVHTIKGLSPLFTVLAYRFFYNIRYSTNTYLSLIPLTLGVMLACSGKHSEYGGELLGLLYALFATMVFVVQNIVSKQLFNEAAKAEAAGLSAKSQKLDKLNLLCYSSGMAFCFTAPIWLWSEGSGILGELMKDGTVQLNHKSGAFDHGRLAMEFLFNGISHFAQNILAFILLSMVSPVTYSVASLLKRVFVIVVAIIWFQSSTTPIQGVGIGLTFLGLYLYDRTHDKDKADRKARLMDVRDDPLLPINTRDAITASQNAPVFESPVRVSAAVGFVANAGDELKKTDESSWSKMPSNGTAAWLAPGTKQEDTWRAGDRKAGL